MYISLALAVAGVGACFASLHTESLFRGLVERMLLISRPGQAQIRTSRELRPMTSRLCSRVKTSMTGRRFIPPGHELKHINWKEFVIHSQLPGMENGKKVTRTCLHNYLTLPHYLTTVLFYVFTLKVLYLVSAYLLLTNYTETLQKL